MEHLRDFPRDEFAKLQTNAAKEGDVDMTRHLVDGVAHVEVINKDSTTALINAAETGNLENVRRLIDHGGDVNIDGDNNGNSPLCIATEASNLEMVGLLLDRGADVNSTDRYGRSSLVLAAIENDWRIVSLLVDHGADINSGDNLDTPLTYAVRNGHLETTQTLLDCGADIDSKDSCGKTSLMLAVERGSWEIVKFLLSSGADVNCRHQYGRTALDFAVKKFRSNRIIKLLMKKALFQSSDAKKPRCSQRKEWSNYWDKCKAEVEKLKKEKIGQSSITFFNFLAMGENKSANFLKNLHVMQELHNFNYETEFPIYGRKIKSQYQNGLSRKGLLYMGEMVIPKLYSSTERNLPTEVCQEIAEYLGYMDLIHLIRASCPA